MLMAGSVVAECLFTIDDFTVTPDQIGTEIALTVKAEFSARVNSWQVDFTYPEGLTPTRAEAGADFDVTYDNAYGNTVLYHRVSFTLLTIAGSLHILQSPAIGIAQILMNIQAMALSSGKAAPMRRCSFSMSR